jgi:uncharacterized membrane protein YgdD (TMEM256/DUF423 family)
MMMMSAEVRTFLVIVGVLGALGVALGAFGAHALSAHFAQHPNRRPTYDTAVMYHLLHTAALFGAALLLHLLAGGEAAAWVRAAGWLFTAGVLLFSGSLYLLAIFNLSFMGAIAPLGGTAFIAGWGMLIIAAARA